MQISSRYLQAARRQRLVAVAFLNGFVRQLDFVILHLLFKGIAGQRVAHSQLEWMSTLWQSR